MVLMRFASLVLGLLCLMHALRGCSAWFHEGSGVQGNRLMVVDDVPATHTRKMKLEGRKMLSEEVPRREIEKAKELSGGTSKISGTDANASERAAISGDHFNNEINNSPTLKQNARRESVHFSSFKLRDYSLFQDSKAVSPESTRAHQDEPRTRFDREISEMSNLMRHDYSGNGNNAPRNCPPINNREPND